MSRNTNLPLGVRQAGVAAILLVFGLALGAVPARVSSIPGVGIENFGKINDHYYRGSQPGQQGLAQLKKLGIKTVIDLRKDSDKAEPGQVRALGMQYFNIPLTSSTPATAEQTSYFLNLVNEAANWPVYVHCKGGRHRTGAMTAVYRISQAGWTADQAFAEMKEYDFNNGLFGGPPAQKKFVYSYYEHYHAAATADKK